MVLHHFQTHPTSKEMVIQKKYHFYAAHRNKEAGEKCGRIHGHTYKVKVHCAFPDFKGDVAMLFGDIDDICESVIKSFDHYFILHDEDPLAALLNSCGEPFIPVPFVTSAENMARHLFDLLEEEGLPITKIEIAETESSNVVYQPSNL